MNKSSIFFKITIFFVAMIIVANVIIYLGYSFTKQQQSSIYISKYLKALHHAKDEVLKKHGIFDAPPPFPPPNSHFRPPHREGKNKEFPPYQSFMESIFTPKSLNDELKYYDLKISNISYLEIETKAKLITVDKDWKLYKYKGFRYFYFSNKHENFLIKDMLKQTQKSQYIIILSILLNILFFVFYLFLITKLKPLINLKDNILLFAEGNLNIDTSCTGEDEISEVSNEFNNAIIQIRDLTNSRNLFLRNIMHELKTPITKGLLISNMMEDGKYKDSLKKAFFRLEYLLREFIRIEEFTSRNIKIKKENFRLVDIIDHSLDILLTDIECIDLTVDDNIVAKVDFELFALTIKNLLDNAIKYGEGKPTVSLIDNTIIIANIGEKLSLKVEEYNKPFNRKYENSNDGLGLGLYIVNNILSAHDLDLNYSYKDNINTFSIQF
jgi:two-component system OmpR family sensor kinase